VEPRAGSDIAASFETTPPEADDKNKARINLWFLLDFKFQLNLMSCEAPTKLCFSLRHAVRHVLKTITEGQHNSCRALGRS